jgi:L-ribulose-5-phosphate 3-epimerase/hexulose-6-phosphate isomerase
VNLKDNLIGIYEKAIPNAFSWEQKLRIAKAAGFDFLEISVDESDARLARLDWSKRETDALNRLVGEVSLPIKSMCLSGHRRFPFGSRDPKVRAAAYAMIDKAILFAKELGIENIQLAGYDVYYETSDEATVERFVEGLRYCAKQAEQADLQLTIEIMDTPLCGTISRVKRFLDLVQSPYLKLYPDLGNLSRFAKDPSAELRLGIDDIVAIHLKDTKEGVFKNVPFGEGDVDFRTLFQTLKELRYDKPFLIEMWADNAVPADFDQTVQAIRSAKEWLQERMNGDA